MKSSSYSVNDQNWRRTKEEFSIKIEKKSGYGVRQKVSRYPARVLFPSSWIPIRNTQLPGHQESTQKEVKRPRLQTKYIDSPIQHLPDTLPLVPRHLIGLDILLLPRSRSRSGIGLLYFPYIPTGILVQAPGRSIPPSALLASRYLHKYGFTPYPDVSIPTPSSAGITIQQDELSEEIQNVHRSETPGFC